MYSIAGKIIHNTKPWHLTNKNKKHNDEKVDLETFFWDRLKVIEKEYNKLNFLYESFFVKIKNHSLFIENDNYLLTIKNFEIHKKYIISSKKPPKV